MHDACVHIYRLLLRAYPRPFYAAYGGLMAQVFQDGLRDARQAGFRAWCWFLIRALADLVVNVTGAYMHAVPFSRRPLGYAWTLTGVLIVAATWPLMMWAFLLSLSFIVHMDAAEGQGTVYAAVAGVLGQPRSLMMAAVLVLLVSSINLARACFRGQGGRWLAFRYALVNATGALSIVFTMWALSQALPQIVPADTAVVILLGAFGMLLAVLFYAQNRACLPRWPLRQSAHLA